jgi:hypothetical protein
MYLDYKYFLEGDADGIDGYGAEVKTPVVPSIA